MWCEVSAMHDLAAVEARSGATLPAVGPIRRHPAVGEFVVERVETVIMTDGQYEQAVNTLATLIVGWATGGKQGSAGRGHVESD
jgi:hypothetical protein